MEPWISSSSVCPALGFWMKKQTANKNKFIYLFSGFHHEWKIPPLGDSCLLHKIKWRCNEGSNLQVTSPIEQIESYHGGASSLRENRIDINVVLPSILECKWNFWQIELASWERSRLQSATSWTSDGILNYWWWWWPQLLSLCLDHNLHVFGAGAEPSRNQFLGRW